MSYRFTDIPKFVPEETYHAAIGRMVKHLLDTGKVVGVYQVGGVSSPGISDIDLFVVLKNEIQWLDNPVSNLQFPDSYLFTHRLFGTCERNAVKLEQYTFFSKYDFLGGTETSLLNYSASEGETEQLKHQVALEYLIKAWYSNAIGMMFGTVKLRNLLLHAKAILLDLKFLGIGDGKLVDCIHEIMEVRKNWFQKQPSATKLSQLVDKYDEGLKDAIIHSISKYGFFLPETANRQVSKRIQLFPSDKLELNRTGFLMPFFVTGLSGKMMKLQNKINEFKVGIPLNQTNIPPILMKRQNLMQEVFAYNHKNLPGFLCTGHAMNIFNREI